MLRYLIPSLLLSLCTSYVHSNEVTRLNPATLPAGQAKFVPPEGKKLLFIGQDNASVGGQNDYSNGYIDALQHYPSGVTGYIPLHDLGSMTHYSNWNAGPMDLSAYANDSRFDHMAYAIGLWFPTRTNLVLNGSFDDNINRLAEWCKEQDRPIFLRIGYEFDSEHHGDFEDNRYSVEGYADAFRYIVDRFDSLDVTNVEYVWQSEGVKSIEEMQDYYPGDEYVDWLAYSIFHIGLPEDWDLTQRGEAIVEMARQKSKPVMIAESSTYNVRMETAIGENVWNDYFSQVFSYIHKNTEIKAFAYINADWDAQPLWAGINWGNSQVQDNEYVLQQWRSEIDNGGWLLSEPTLWDEINYPYDGNDEPPSTTPAPTSTPTATPTTTPEPTPNINPKINECDDDFGIAYIDDNTLEVYHRDFGWSASWSYICLNNYCVAAQSNDTYFSAAFSGQLGQTYDIEFKVQDNALGQELMSSQSAFTTSNCTLH